MRRSWMVWLAVLVPTLAWAVPVQVPYSGQLAENGELVTGTRDLVIKIYDAQTAGTQVYSEGFAATTVTNGVFHILLSAPANVWNGADRWLGVAVNGAAELTPRVRISSVPYAVRAGVAENLASPPAQPGVEFAFSAGSQSVSFSGPVSYQFVTVDCPAAGYVVVQSHGYGAVAASSGNVLTFSISQSPFAHGAAVSQIATGSTSSITAPLSVCGVFQVLGPGPQLFHLMAGAPFPGATVNQVGLVAQWFPIRY